MASLLNWLRVEPDSTTDIATTLRAEIRDPMWMLARQWQLGEFRGEDAGSPAFVDVSRRIHPLAATPIEPDQLALRPDPDLAKRINAAELLLEELGDLGERMRPLLRKHAPLPVPDPRDVAGTRLHRMAQRFYFDGFVALKLYGEVEKAFPPADVQRFYDATLEIRRYWEALGVLVPLPDAPGYKPPASERWDASRLRYSLETKTSDGLAFTGAPGADGDTDWYSLDLAEVRSAPQPAASTTRVQPTFVSFRGMPNHRYWDFEDGSVNLGAVVNGPRDVTKAIALEFMTVHGNDWFVVPLDQDVGTCSEVTALVVTDVFGITREVRPASELDPTWAMFEPAGGRSLLVLPPTLSRVAQRGAFVEETLFARDEPANLVWAIETCVRSAAGGTWMRTSIPKVATTPPPQGWSYELMPTYRSNWRPYQVGTASDLVYVANATVVDENGKPLLDSMFNAVVKQAPPAHVLHDEEVSHLGVSVRLQYHFARAHDGASYLWAQFERTHGAGEVRSDMAFDIARKVHE